MQKRDPFLLGADAGGFVDESNTGRTTTRESGVEVVDEEAEVMDSGPTFGHKSADRRFRSVGFEQLDERVAGSEADDRRAVGVVERHVWQAEDVTIEG